MDIITILGDSLALPRPGTPWKKLYSYKLNLLLHPEYYVVNKARRSNTVVKQTNDIDPGDLIEDIIYLHESQWFVIQLGIVDCAPRLFSEFQSLVLKWVRPSCFREILIRGMSKHRYFFTKYFPKVYVSQEQFKGKYTHLIETIINKTAVKKIIIINIADTNTHSKKRSFHFEENIKTYNSILKELSSIYQEKVILFDFYSVTSANPDLILSDGIHLTNEAHTIISEFIYNQIKTHAATVTYAS